MRSEPMESRGTSGGVLVQPMGIGVYGGLVWPSWHRPDVFTSTQIDIAYGQRSPQRGLGSVQEEAP